MLQRLRSRAERPFVVLGARAVDRVQPLCLPRKSRWRQCLNMNKRDRAWKAGIDWRQKRLLRSRVSRVSFAKKGPGSRLYVEGQASLAPAREPLAGSWCEYRFSPGQPRPAQCRQPAAKQADPARHVLLCAHAGNNSRGNVRAGGGSSGNGGGANDGR